MSSTLEEEQPLQWTLSLLSSTSSRAPSKSLPTASSICSMKTMQDLFCPIQSSSQDKVVVNQQASSLTLPNPHNKQSYLTLHSSQVLLQVRAHLRQQHQLYQTQDQCPPLQVPINYNYYKCKNMKL